MRIYSTPVYVNNYVRLLYQLRPQENFPNSFYPTDYCCCFWADILNYFFFLRRLPTAAAGQIFWTGFHPKGFYCIFILLLFRLQKSRSTKTEITNVNNYESAIDGYEMQSHQPVDANDLANAATESGVDSGVHDSGVSDSGILDSNTTDSISESRILDGDGASNQDSRRSTESLHE